MRMNQIATSEVAIWSRVLEPGKPIFSAAAARSILALDFHPADRERMQELAAKARAGTLSPDEQSEIDNYEKVGHLLSLLKAKARISVKTSA